MLLVFNAFFSIVSVVNVCADIDPADINYSWELDTFSAHVSRVWDDTEFLTNETGSFNDIFNYSRGYAISEDEWLEEESVYTYNVNYSYFSNLTLTGDFTLDVNLDVYKVDISYGSSVYFIWIGFKNGTYCLEVNVNNISRDYKYENTFYKKTVTTYKKYNISTMELLDAWEETIEDSGAWTAEPEPGRYDDFSSSCTLDMEFSMPLILTFQVYEAQNGEKVAWGEMISDFYVFEDLDKNGVYSVGETKGAEDTYHMFTSDEYRGKFTPWAHDYTVHSYSKSPTDTINYTRNYKFPGDKEVSEFGESVQFTPPQLNGNEVDWSINYPEFPIDAYINNEPDYFYIESGANYADTSPGNFSYDFNYEITNETAGLDLTAHLPRLSNQSFFNAVDNLSLAFPHYTYFLSSADISEFEGKIITIPSNMFQFDVGDTKVAEIDMESELKEYYALMDYPDLGNNRTFKAIGSSVSRLITNELGDNPLVYSNWFLDTVFALGDLDLVKLDPDFDSAFSLFNIEIQNYPTWSGYEIIHDPTLTIYHGQQDSDDTGPIAIPGYDLCVIAVIIGVITILIARKKKLCKKF
jgi:hypothetical protein